MRIYLGLSKNKAVIPYNYHQLMTGVIHKWIGENNEEHGRQSLYSFSWFQNTNAGKIGIDLTRDSYFFISAYNSDLIKNITKGILKYPEMFCGIRVVDIRIKLAPEFSGEERFFLSSPVLIRKRENDKVKHVTFKDEDFESLLTQNFRRKLSLANLASENVSIQLDKSYAFPQTKLVDYKGVKNKTTITPVIIKGTPEQIAFAWEVGLGESTGIGFGALK